MNTLAKLAIDVLAVPALNAIARGVNQLWRRERQPTYRYDRATGGWTAKFDGMTAPGPTKAAAARLVRQLVADREANIERVLREAEEMTRKDGEA